MGNASDEDGNSRPYQKRLLLSKVWSGIWIGSLHDSSVSNSVGPNSHRGYGSQQWTGDNQDDPNGAVTSPRCKMTCLVSNHREVIYSLKDNVS
mmetsp:Transcript_1814/g.1931  ORF Transcript_1814/g.1931 Transcript_1814/m.1931 type:complete len:93 (-) Transcript_1814:92-370(-)